MDYRILGRTGLKVSQLGFGAMRLPMVADGDSYRVNDDLAVPMIHRAFEGGINYIDSAVMYCNDDSQRAVGVALKGWRDRIIVSTKNHYFGTDEKSWWQNLENSLRLLDIETIDIYNYHGVNWNCYKEHIEPLVSRWMQKAKDRGLIRFICSSFHDNNDSLKKLVATGYADVITLQYNLLDRQLEEGIAVAHEYGLGVVVMGPIGGGRLTGPSDVLGSMVKDVSRIPELALRFVLANPNVSVALSGMSTIQQVEENLRIASDVISLTHEEKQEIDAHLVRLLNLADLYCTGCRYCLPCPEGVDIPGIFEKFNRGRVYGLWESAREAYQHMGQDPWDNGKRADFCVLCGNCEEKCPQNIAIRDQLQEAHKALGGETVR